MKLTIRDFSKIAHAEILVDGITVIAGENNTGKSTVGKILFSLFNALSNMEEKIQQQRLKEAEDISRRLIKNAYENHIIGKDGFLVQYPRRLRRDLQKKLEENKEITCQDVHESVEHVFTSKEFWREELREQFDEISDELEEKIYAILKLPEETIMREVLTEYFNDVFHNQINSLIVENKNAVINIEIKNKKINVIFDNNRCVDLVNGLAILHQAVYIDNPFIADKFSEYHYVYGDMNRMDEHLVGLLMEKNDAEDMDGVFERVMNKEKLAEVYRTLETVVEGEIVQQPNGDFSLRREGFFKPVHFGNLSNGLKSFAILKLLLEKGMLKEKDVLILDEPEIHLHPKWQIAYAELVVLLQKAFDLSVVVTTHSPYFLDAIHLYSLKHKVGDKTNYYLSEMTDDQVTMENVTGNLDMIYKKMSTPIDALETLRYELNNGD